MAIAAVLIWTGCSEEDALNNSRQGLSSISAVIDPHEKIKALLKKYNVKGGAAAE